MPLFRGVILFGFDVYGWSEVFGIDAADTGTALTDLHALTIARAGLALATVTLTSGVHELLQPRNATYSSSIFGSYTPSGTVYTVVPSVCLEVTKYCDTPPNGRLFMRGLPEDIVQGDGLNPPTAWQTAYSTWNGLFTAGNLGVLKKGPGPTPAYTVRPIINSSRNARLATRRVGRPFFQPRGRRVIV